MKVAFVDLGSQYSPVLRRRLRELGCDIIECEPQNIPLDLSPVVLSGGPGNAHDQFYFSPQFEKSLLQRPVLGICLGHQWIAHQLGGVVKAGHTREYGLAIIEGKKWNHQRVWMSHADSVAQLPRDFEAWSMSGNILAAMAHKTAKIIGLQFHPEVFHTHHGREILIDCLSHLGVELKQYHSVSSEEIGRKIQSVVQKDRVLLGLSGGVDSLVVAALLQKYIPGQFFPVFVDTGLMRRYDVRDLKKIAHELAIPLFIENHSFVPSLKDIVDPEKKRKIVGSAFIEAFENIARQHGPFKFLAQGTLASDVIESQGSKKSVTIKSHHNVGGLPEKLGFQLLEPVRELFKDQVRVLGEELGLGEFAWRHPFPGPGLAVRCLGPVTPDRIAALSHADEILFEEMRAHDVYDQTWQAFMVATGAKSVGVKGDNRAYEEVFALRAVDSVDGMTANVSRLPWDFLESVSGRVVNEVPGVGRVVFDISRKPPATIEWE